MSASRTAVERAGRRARSHVRRVALGATLLALVTYLLACAMADLVVLDHLAEAIDARLTARIDEVGRMLPPGGPTGPIRAFSSEIGGDLDGAPILLWWVRAGDRKVVPLEASAPTLPRSAIGVTAPANVMVAGRELRLLGATLPSGRLIAGTSARESRSALSTLLLIEAVLAPVVLLTLYLAAWIIGRRAAAPIERSRRRQLEFTADASHELRTPLSVIEAEVGLALHAERSQATYRTALERIADESKRLRDIVEDLLWLARLDALPEAPPDEAVDLASLAAVCASRFAAVAARRRIAITVGEADALDSSIVAPAEWLDRLVSVLLDNACRYASDGGRVGVSVSTTADHVLLTIDDDGPGIPEEQREQIFERFHRASTMPGGAGLGLSIANAVVQATGGSWTVGTSPLGGARIQVSWRH